jgi:hypothetical protein
MSWIAERVMRYRFLRLLIWRSLRWYVLRKWRSRRATLARAMLFGVFGLALRVLGAIARRRGAEGVRPRP